MAKFAIACMVISLMIAYLFPPPWFTWQTVQRAFSYVASLYMRIFFSSMTDAYNLLFQSIVSLPSPLRSFWSFLEAMIFFGWAATYFILAIVWICLSITTLFVLTLIAATICKGSLPNYVRTSLTKFFCLIIWIIAPQHENFCKGMFSLLMQGELRALVHTVSNNPYHEGAGVAMMVIYSMASIALLILTMTSVTSVAAVMIAMRP